MLAYGFGRLACFFAGDVYGKISTLPFAVTYTNPRSSIPPVFLGFPLHPLPLYESLIVLSLFFYSLNSKTWKRYDGQISTTILAWYSASRFAIEFLRSEYDRLPGFLGLNSCQLVCIGIFAFCLSGLILNRYKGPFLHHSDDFDNDGLSKGRQVGRQATLLIKKILSAGRSYFTSAKWRLQRFWTLILICILTVVTNARPDGLTFAKVQSCEVEGNQIAVNLKHADKIPTRFRDLRFSNRIGKVGVPARIEVILEQDRSRHHPIEDEQVCLQIFREGNWHNIQDEFVQTSLQTGKVGGRKNHRGMASIYFLPTKEYLPPSLDTAEYLIRAVYNGNSIYAPVQIVAPLTIIRGHWKEIPIGKPKYKSRIPLVLVHGYGQERDKQTLWGWKRFLEHARTNQSAFEDFDIYIWRHDTSLPIGFNGCTGNAAQLAEYVDTLSTNYAPGAKILFVAHSRGGLVVRAFMNYEGQGDKVLGLVTLGTPHHGSPLAVPEWAAIGWHNSMHPGTELFFDFFMSDRESAVFGTDRIGSLNLGWDNLDNAISQQTVLSLNVEFAVDGKVYLTPNDMNNPSKGLDPTVFYSNTYKSKFGTLYELNQKEKYHTKIVAFAAYQEDINDKSLKLFEVFSDSNSLLQLSASILSKCHKGIINIKSNFLLNDGLVPLQSALFLDISDGGPFAFYSNGRVQINKERLKQTKLLKRHRIFTEKVETHLDLLHTESLEYWRALEEELRCFVGHVSSHKQSIIPTQMNEVELPRFRGRF